MLAEKSLQGANGANGLVARAALALLLLLQVVQPKHFAGSLWTERAYVIFRNAFLFLRFCVSCFLCFHFVFFYAVCSRCTTYRPRAHNQSVYEHV